MALFSRETLAEVFWEAQSPVYTPWWGESEWTHNGIQKDKDGWEMRHMSIHIP